MNYTSKTWRSWKNISRNYSYKVGSQNYYEIYSNNDSGYRFRVSKLSGMGAYVEDAAGIARSNISFPHYSYPMVLKYDSSAYVEKVSNGGVESGSGTPSDWSTYMEDPAGSCVWDSGTYHSGNKSLKITINTASPAKHGCWTQDISGISGGKSYELSYYIKTQNIARSDMGGYGAFCSVVYKDSLGTVIAEDGSTMSMGGTNDWTYMHTYVSTPANTASVQISLRLWGTTGSVWYDDVHFQKTADMAMDGNGNLTPTTLTYNNLASDHKQIVCTKGNETLYYDFYPDRMDIKVTGSNPGGYIIQDGGYRPMSNARIVWPDGTVNSLSGISPGESLQGSGTSVYLHQFASPYAVKYTFGSPKSVKFVNGLKTNGYYERFQVNSGETYSVYFSKVNNVQNPGVEINGGSGPANWNTYGSGTFVWDSATCHWGTKAVKIVNSNAATTCWYQSMSNFETDKEYEATAWIKTTSVSGGMGTFLSVTAKDSGGNILCEAMSPVLTGTNGWTQVKVRMVTPRNTAVIEVAGKLWGATGTVWVDDFSFYPADNAVTNPGGEKGTSSPDGWATWTSSGTPFTWDGTARSGSKSMKISQATAQTSCWYQNLSNLQVHKEYEFSGWVKASGVTGGHGAFVAFIAKDVNGNIIQEGWTPAVTGTQDWTYVKQRLILPPKTASVTIQGNLWGSTGTAWFDDLKVSMVK